MPETKHNFRIGPLSGKKCYILYIYTLSTRKVGKLAIPKNRAHLSLTAVSLENASKSGRLSNRIVFRNLETPLLTHWDQTLWKHCGKVAHEFFELAASILQQIYSVPQDERIWLIVKLG